MGLGVLYARTEREDDHGKHEAARLAPRSSHAGWSRTIRQRRCVPENVIAISQLRRRNDDRAAHAVSLTINTGSSSLKAALYKVGPEEQVAFTASTERDGRSDSRIRMTDGRGVAVLDRLWRLPNHDAVLQVLLRGCLTNRSPPGLGARG